MSCVSCGTELPFGAMFCGECGRSVRAGSAIRPEAPSADVDAPAAAPEAAAPAAADMHCTDCGSVVRVGDIFCGECGAVVAVVNAVDTLIIERRDLDDALAPPWFLDAPQGDEAEGGDSQDVVPEPEVELAASAAPKPKSKPKSKSKSTLKSKTDSRAESAAESASESKSESASESKSESEFESTPTAAPAALPVEPIADAAEDPVPLGESVDEAEPQAQSVASEPDAPLASLLFADTDDDEHTRIVPRRAQGERFILQFSTGESFTVFGTGLLGRNPLPEPGEYFDQMVAISDPGKSVSKTHLEFGQEAGAFWVADRFSGNGSVVREPELGARRCEPGRRYRMVRGSRVDIGEQFFVVS